MRTGTCSQGMYETHPSCYSRGKANTEIRAKDIIVHGLGNCNDRKSFPMQPLSKTERIISAYGDNGINFQYFQILKDMGC